jgi:hypothetical protein
MSASPLDLTELKVHPSANLFLMMHHDELHELACDIEKYGMYQPIVLLDGKILDGRNRYHALKLIDHQFSAVDFIRFEELDGADDPEAYAVSMNMRRRHYNELEKGLAKIHLRILEAFDQCDSLEAQRSLVARVEEAMAKLLKQYGVQK